MQLDKGQLSGLKEIALQVGLGPWAVVWKPML